MMIQLHILTPEGTLVRKEVERVELPGSKGRFVVLKDHAPLVSSLVEGEVVYGPLEGKGDMVKISSGFVEVIGNQVTVCVEV